MTAPHPRKLKVCLAASGGGHLRQLLQMLPFASEHDYYFLTEPTPLGLSLAEDHTVRFVPHFAFGQRQTEGWFRFLLSAIANLVSSVWNFLCVRPDVIVSTGAGAAYFTLLLGWIFRRKIIYFESIARVEKISLFGRLAARFAGRYHVQWPALEALHPDAIYCNPFRAKEEPPGEKEDRVFVTVGTVLPFDRMIGLVEALRKEGVITGDIVAQIGESDQAFEGMVCHQTMSQDDLNKELDRASIAIVHGGSGSMLGAMRYGCHVIAIPREYARGEHYDDHQFELVGAFAGQGLVTQVETLDDLRSALEAVKDQEPKAVEINADAYRDAINGWLREIGMLN